MALLVDGPGRDWEAVLARTGKQQCLQDSEALLALVPPLTCLLSVPPHPQSSRLFPSSPLGAFQSWEKIH